MFQKINHKIVLSCLFILALFSTVVSSGQLVEFTAFFDGSVTSDEAYSVKQTSDGGYVLCGQRWNISNWDAWVVKADSLGNMQWNVTLGGSGTDECREVIEVGTDIVFAGTYNNGSGNKAWLVKLNLTGGILFNNKLNPTSNNSVYGLDTTSDGGYIVTGINLTFGPQFWAWLAKADSSGNLLWENTIGGVNSYGFGVEQAADNSFIVTGRQQTAGGYNVSVYKCTSAGVVSWTRQYDFYTASDATSQGNRIKQTADGNFVVVGEEYMGNYQVLLMKIDSSGNLLWNSTWGSGNYDVGRDFVITPDGGFAVVGDYNGQDLWLIKANSSGSHEWNKIIDNTVSDKGYGIDLTSEGGYILAGENGADVLLVKVLGQPLPNSTEFIGSGFNGTNTTDLEDVSLDLENVPSLTLAEAGNGSIQWSGNTNVSGFDLDTQIEIGEEFVWVNSSSLHPSINSAATIKLNVSSCPVDTIVMWNGESEPANADQIRRDGVECTHNGVCQILSCDPTTKILTFTVNGFSAFASNADSNLTIDHNGPMAVDMNITFNASYINKTDGSFIAGSSCNITFSDNPGIWFEMNESATIYWYNKSFSSSGNYTYNVTCENASYTQIWANDTVEVMPGMAPSNVTVFKTSSRLTYNDTEIILFLVNITNNGGDGLTEVALYEEFTNTEIDILNVSLSSVYCNYTTAGAGEVNINITKCLGGVLTPGSSAEVYINFSVVGMAPFNTTNFVEVNATSGTMVEVNAYANSTIGVNSTSFIQIQYFENDDTLNFTLVGRGLNIAIPENITLYLNATKSSSAGVNITHNGICFGPDPIQMAWVGEDFEANCTIDKSKLAPGQNLLNATAYLYSQPNVQATASFILLADFQRPDIEFSWRTMRNESGDPNNIPEPHDIFNESDFFYSPVDNFVTFEVNVTDDHNVTLVQVFFDPADMNTNFDNGCLGTINLTKNSDGFWNGSCSLGSFTVSDLNSPSNNVQTAAVVITAYDEYGNQNNMYNRSDNQTCPSDWSMGMPDECITVQVPIAVHDIGVVESTNPCLDFTTTNFSQVMDFTNVLLVIDVDVNVSCWTGNLLLPSNFRDAAIINFSGLDLEDQYTALKLQNLDKHIIVDTVPPYSFGDSRIYINSTYFEELDITATIKMIGLPFTAIPLILEDFGAAGVIGITESVSWFNTDYDITTTNVTFSVFGFSGYNLTDAVNPSIKVVTPLNSQNYNTNISLIQFRVNGTGTEPSYIRILIDGTVQLVYNNTPAGIKTMSCANISSNKEIYECNVSIIPELTDGTHNFTINAFDFGGNAPGNSDTNFTQFSVDATAPSVMITTPANNSFFNSNFVSYSVNGTVNDGAGTGVHNVSVFVNGIFGGLATTVGNFWNYTWLMPADGKYNITARACDNSANCVNSIYVVNITVDKTAPTTADDAPAGWQLAPLSVNLSATDATSGISFINYSIDWGPWTISPINVSILVNTDGNHSIDYYSVDNAGNDDSINTVYIALDTTNPTGSITRPSNNEIINGNYAPYGINGTALDPASGINNVTVFIDDAYAGTATITGTNWTYSWPWGTPISSTHNITARIYDNAGRMTQYFVGNLLVDSIAPEIYGATMDKSVTYNSATITFNANESVIRRVFYGLNDTELTSQTGWTSSYLTTGSVVITGLSALTNYSYKVRACDRAGNCVNSSETWTLKTAAVPPPVKRTSGGSSSGGGGGGGVLLTTNEDITDDLMAGLTVTSRLYGNDYVWFVFDGENHTIRIVELDFNKKKLTIEVTSTPERYVMDEGQTIGLDLNNNNYADVSVKAVEVGTSYGIIDVKLISEKVTVEEFNQQQSAAEAAASEQAGQSLSQQTAEQAIQTPAEQSQPEAALTSEVEKEVKESKGKLDPFLLIIGIIAVVAVIIATLLVFLPGPRHEVEHELHEISERLKKL